MSVPEPQPVMPTPARRRYRFTSDRLIVGLLAAECLLWLSDGLSLPISYKGYAMLTGLALVGMATIVMLLSFVAAMAFRLRFQFSIRCLLMLTVAVAIPCSQLAWDATSERIAIATIQKCGHAAYKKSIVPAAIRKCLGNWDYFDRVYAVGLFDQPGVYEQTDELIRALRKLKYLREVVVAERSVVSGEAPLRRACVKIKAAMPDVTLVKIG